ncbi:ty3-gypsy retrotransposon protein [Tanacetum coccineum]
MVELEEIRLLIKKQSDAFQAQMAALQADLQATKGLFQAGRNGGGGETASPIPRSMRLDVPKFSRTDSDRWIFSITEYFTLLSTSVDQRLGVVGFNLEGDAAEWFRWMTHNKLITTWDGFLESVQNHFGPCKSQTLVTTGILESKPTTLGDAFSLAHITEARLGDQEVSSVSNTAIVNSGGGHNQKNNVELVKPALWTTPPKPTCNLDEDAEADQDNLKDQGDTLKSVVERMKLAVSITKPLNVYIGSGETLLCENICSKVGINMQGLAVEVDLYVLPRKGPDVVLGIQWLQKLGKVTHDYVEWIMEFILEGVTHTLWDPGIKIFLDETLRARWFRRSRECYAPSLVIFVMFD